MAHSKIVACNNSQQHGSANIEFFNTDIDSPLFTKNYKLMKLMKLLM